MDKYFAGKGNEIEVSDYTQALEDMYTAYNGQLSKAANLKSIVWISKALEKEMDASTHTRLLIMLAQCFRDTDNGEKAKQCLNQAFVTSAGIEEPMEKEHIQGVIKQNLQGL